MSANEKDLRAARQAERREKKSAAAAEKEKKDRRYRRNAVIVIAIFIVLIIGALLINSNIFYTKTTALTVGTTKYSPAEVSYFYQSTYNSMYQNISDMYGSYMSLVLDTSTPLNEQLYPFDDTGTMTWADAVVSTAHDDLVRVTAFYDAAVKAGRTLTEEERATIESGIQSFKDYAAASGYSNADKFFAAYYGKGVNEATVRKLQERLTLASAYYAEVYDSFNYTDAELASYYAAHSEDLDYYRYYSYSVYPSMDQFSELEEDERLDHVRAAAQEIADAATDEQSFLDAVSAFSGDSSPISMSSYHASSISELYKDWITDPVRQPGDVTIIEGSSTSYLLFFVGYDNNDYNTVDFRHILIKAEEDEEGNYTEESDSNSHR